MKKLFFFIIPAVIFLAGCTGTSPEYRNYENALKLQMQEMINVLNAGHANQFMSTYVDPTYINSMGGVDAALLQFGNARQVALQNALKVAKNVTPMYNENSKSMIYTTMGLPEPIVFKQKGSKWYLQSDWLKE